MFNGSTEDLPNYIPGYDEYIDMLIDEQILERMEN